MNVVAVIDDDVSPRPSPHFRRPFRVFISDCCVFVVDCRVLVTRFVFVTVVSRVFADVRVLVTQLSVLVAIFTACLLRACFACLLRACFGLPRDCYCFPRIHHCKCS